MRLLRRRRFIVGLRRQHGGEHGLTDAEKNRHRPWVQARRRRPERDADATGNQIPRRRGNDRPRQESQRGERARAKRRRPRARASIHATVGAERTIVAVSNAPATTHGKNCSHARPHQDAARRRIAPMPPPGIAARDDARRRGDAEPQHRDSPPDLRRAAARRMSATRPPPRPGPPRRPSAKPSTRGTSRSAPSGDESRRSGSTLREVPLQRSRATGVRTLLCSAKHNAATCVKQDELRGLQPERVGDGLRGGAVGARFHRAARAALAEAADGAGVAEQRRPAGPGP